MEFEPGADRVTKSFLNLNLPIKYQSASKTTQVSSRTRSFHCEVSLWLKVHETYHNITRRCYCLQLTPTRKSTALSSSYSMLLMMEGWRIRIWNRKISEHRIFANNCKITFYVDYSNCQVILVTIALSSG